MRLFILMVFILVSGCCPKICRPNITNYPIKEQLKEAVFTPSGAMVVWTNGEISKEMLTKIDRDIDFVESCISSHQRFFRKPKRKCYVIYIAPDYRKSCVDPAQQVFGVAPDSACKSKGLNPDEECPCGWRVAIQDGKYIVVTPSLHMLRAGLTELMTGMPQYYIWHPDEKMKWITKCASNDESKKIH